ncbi:hypothetical protein DFH11DRAFT_1543544 [Phellopilus nigrolimitatus]|nr:hypothetical protein DFH11DRAFT_1543544 [Phellopilus nigrolimitatus]
MSRRAGRREREGTGGRGSTPPARYERDLTLASDFMLEHTCRQQAGQDTTGTGWYWCVDAAPGLAPLASLMSHDAARALGAAALCSVLLNVLDGVSCRALTHAPADGMIMFPANAIFPAFGGIGISMFFVTYYHSQNARSTIIAQLAYSCSASSFEREHDDRGRGRAWCFGLLQLVAFTDLVRSLMSSKQFKSLNRVAVVLFSILDVLVFGALTMNGWIAPWTGHFYSLWDTGYARTGMYLCFNELCNEQVFVIIYAFVGSYFAGVMVHLMLTLTPA